MAVPTRVRPRMPMEQLVDKDVHPARRKVATVPDGEHPAGLHWTTRVALVALVVFWVATPAAGVAGPLVGLWAGLSLAGLAVSSLVVFFVLGSE